MQMHTLPTSVNQAAEILQPHRNQPGYLTDALTAAEYHPTASNKEIKLAQKLLRQAAKQLDDGATKCD